MRDWTKQACGNKQPVNKEWLVLTFGCFEKRNDKITKAREAMTSCVLMGALVPASRKVNAKNSSSALLLMISSVQENNVLKGGQWWELEWMTIRLLKLTTTLIRLQHNWGLYSRSGVLNDLCEIMRRESWCPRKRRAGRSPVDRRLET
jgi:hypothetical protein